MLVCVSVPRTPLLAPSYFIEVLPGLEPWERAWERSHVCAGRSLSRRLGTRSSAESTDAGHTGRKHGSTDKRCLVQYFKERVQRRQSRTHPPLLEIATKGTFRAGF